MHLLNLTPHPLHVECSDGRLLILEPEAVPARCAQTEQPVGTLQSAGYAVALTRQAFGAVEGLPEPRPHVRLVVSRLVAEASPGRDDLLVPGPAVRDESGRIVGCRGLAVVTPAPRLSPEQQRAVEEAARYEHATGGDYSDTAWHLGACLAALRALGVDVPTFGQREGLPPAVLVAQARAADGREAAAVE